MRGQWICICMAIWILWNSLSVNCAASEVMSGQMEEMMDSYLEELDLQELEREIKYMLPDSGIQFREAVMQLVKGELPLEWESVREIAESALFSEIRRQRTLVTQILFLAVAASVFTNFVKVFRKNQISDIAFYFIYLLLFVLIMKGFQSLTGVAEESIGQILQFMKLLLPVYLVVASLAAGSLTAMVFYEITLLLITAVQMILLYIVLPGIGFYVLFHLLNHLGKEEYLSKLAELIRSILSWIMKTMLTLVVGVQTVQGLLLPAIDSLKNSVWTKATGALPVIGNTFASVTETVLGTAVLLKNAVGVAGLLVIMVLCLTPVIRLLVCTILYKAVGAAVQPVSDRRITECISGVGDGIGMLLKAVAATGLMFLITLAMVTASIRG